MYMKAFVFVFFLNVVLSQCSTDGELRYTNEITTTNSSGTFTTARVEVCYNGTYGAICDKYYSKETAELVCQNRFSATTGQGKLLRDIIDARAKVDETLSVVYKFKPVLKYKVDYL